jgi:flagellar hook-basal body complex protein FliE
MTVPIGGAGAFTQGIQGGDTGARQVPVFGKGNDAGTFGETLTKAINAVSDQQENAANLTASFARGDNVELHQVMAASEEASLSLEMVIAVRDKFTEAYKSLISMQG